MGSFSVSVVFGGLKRTTVGDVFKLAGCFAIFHILMPVIGWLGGVGLKNIISGIDHWIAFGLLSAVGFKMIYEGFFAHPEVKEMRKLDFKTIFTLAFATSLDALAVGVSFAFIKISLAWSILVIGAVIFVITLFGAVIGKKFAKIVGSKAEIFGGLVLILIGVKILIEHL